MTILDDEIIILFQRTLNQIIFKRFNIKDDENTYKKWTLFFWKSGR